VDAVGDDLDINDIIQEAIEKFSPNEAVKQFLLNSIQYELDIWNRTLRPKEIDEKYESISEKILNKFEWEDIDEI